MVPREREARRGANAVALTLTIKRKRSARDSCVPGAAPPRKKIRLAATAVDTSTRPDALLARSDTGVEDSVPHLSATSAAATTSLTNNIDDGVLIAAADTATATTPLIDNTAAVNPSIEAHTFNNNRPAIVIGTKCLCPFKSRLGRVYKKRRVWLGDNGDPASSAGGDQTATSITDIDQHTVPGAGGSASASSTSETGDDSFDPFDFDFDIDPTSAAGIRQAACFNPGAITFACASSISADSSSVADTVNETTEPSPNGESAGRSGSGSGSKSTRRSPHSKQGSRFNPLSSSHWATKRELGLEEGEDYDFDTRAIIPAPSYEVIEGDHMAILIENMNLRSGPTVSDHSNLASSTLQPLPQSVNTNSAPATDAKSASHSKSKTRLPGSKKDRSKPNKKNDTTSSRQ
ncbi:hypothetical protein GGH93_003605 [Coemansia aciculifera]|nr:hypothetical protein GGH93_003605 [Coemansia aciculifera]